MDLVREELMIQAQRDGGKGTELTGLNTHPHRLVAYVSRDDSMRIIFTPVREARRKMNVHIYIRLRRAPKSRPLSSV